MAVRGRRVQCCVTKSLSVVQSSMSIVIYTPSSASASIVYETVPIFPLTITRSPTLLLMFGRMSRLLCSPNRYIVPRKCHLASFGDDFSEDFRNDVRKPLWNNGLRPSGIFAETVDTCWSVHPHTDTDPNDCRTQPTTPRRFALAWNASMDRPQNSAACLVVIMPDRSTRQYRVKRTKTD